MLPHPMSKPTPENADLLLVGDKAADRLGIAEMAIRADDARHDVPDRHAISHLRQRAVIVLAEHLQGRVLEFRRLGPHRRDAFGRRLSLSRKMLLPRRVSIGAPCRHRAQTRALNPAVRVNAGSKAKLARAGLV
jgi:hypothetical protein